MFISETLSNYIQSLDLKRQALQQKHGKSLGWLLGIPLLAGILAVVIASVPQAFFVGAGIAGVISMVYHITTVSGPFSEIKSQLKTAILEDLMETFHPDVEFTHSHSNQDVRRITEDSGLVSANRYSEEDVIEGKYGDTEFYISEVHLERKRKKSRVTVFDGLLFKIKLPGKRLPSARIQSRPGLLSRLFGGYEENEEFGFQYDTDDTVWFNDELGKLFPFFRHLIQQNKDVRISIKNNEIVMFLNSDMKFLDDPEPRLTQPLMNNEYVENFAQQLNSLLFIVESLSNDLNSEEIEERLELKVREYVKRTEKV